MGPVDITVFILVVVLYSFERTIFKDSIASFTSTCNFYASAPDDYEHKTNYFKINQVKKLLVHNFIRKRTDLALARQNADESIVMHL